MCNWVERHESRRIDNQLEVGQVDKGIRELLFFIGLQDDMRLFGEIR